MLTWARTRNVGFTKSFWRLTRRRERAGCVRTPPKLLVDYPALLNGPKEPSLPRRRRIPSEITPPLRCRRAGLRPARGAREAPPPESILHHGTGPTCARAF